MIRLFIDSDIILDVLARRKEYESASLLLKLVDKKEIIAGTSPIVVANVHYILSKYTTARKSKQALKILQKTLIIYTVDQKIIEEALDLDFKDFEDGIQFLAAREAQVDFIITRNKSDYNKSTIPVMDAREFIDMYLDSKDSSDKG